MSLNKLIGATVFIVLFYLSFSSHSNFTVPSKTRLRHFHNQSRNNWDYNEPYNMTIGNRNFTCYPSYSKAFRNILVVIQFTIRFKEKIEQDIEDLYSCFLPNIVRYTACPKNDNSTINGMHCLPLSKSIEKRFKYADNFASFYQYEYMVDAMDKNPNFDGYIFMQEDVVLNFWNFPVRHNFDKVWRTIDFPDPDTDVWKKHNNIPIFQNVSDQRFVDNICRSFVNSNEFPNQNIKDFVDGFKLEERNQLYLQNSLTGDPAFRMANSDFYYVPQRYRKRISEEMKRALVHEVFQEVAVPIIFDCVVGNNSYEVASGAALFRVSDSIQKFALYDPCWDFFHKIKISKKREFEFLIDTILRYGPMTGKWDCLKSGYHGLNSYFRIRDSPK